MAQNKQFAMVAPNRRKITERTNMIRSRLFSTFVVATALAATLIIAGCHGNNPNGVYTDSTGRATLEFKDGKAYMNLGGLAIDGTPYDVKDDKITIHYPSDGMLAVYSNMTVNSDGTLQSGMGIWKKK
ncbi:MAG: hypothetical protein ACREQT_11705 [Candidatus Binataceae bacterium]